MRLRHILVRYLRAHPFASLFLLVAVVCAHFWPFETPFGLGLAVLFMFTPLALGSSLVTLLICGVALVQRTDAARARFRGALGVCAWCAALMFGMQHGRRHAERKLEEGFAPAIAALDAFHRRHGSYPASLSALAGVQLPPRASYHRYEPGPRNQFELYCITFNTIVFLKHSYCSNQPRWRDWD